ncbi:hypothetical protein B5C01_01560 [Staphylococcus delphini]|uniref:Uncharacterized protein n=1 Tax=Staphylococcus delphini TaxID=53344 RepID=A0A2A4GYM0_9STAP|nr:hypothetical protein B5C08_05045 [Staphylococcus delphini]PCF63563.1 hypothetical protein B5C01_01560 [Staphylococcus delphini]
MTAKTLPRFTPLTFIPHSPYMTMMLKFIHWKSSIMTAKMLTRFTPLTFITHSPYMTMTLKFIHWKSNIRTAKTPQELHAHLHNTLSLHDNDAEIHTLEKQHHDCKNAPETPEGSDVAENPIWLPSSVHLNLAKFS